ncbi:hypothetical protein CAPTEDRAFT_149364 [Capitella teleta]|uniref:non-specific serine/threonine protein kinase n=1 Tax=Capitella teleta TaxID=283909 RepID=R7V2Y0_CAPTE|nr:hypothetical protein CAPTEDRAFT_149364 [Capitella teleta]|eukprot:ELU13193.1 hypothetical protein CAPTEDRAFT_149364 [Capitella teleta]
MMVAMPIMKQLIAELDQVILSGIDESCVHLLPKCLTMYGAMLAETHSENPLAIYENYLQRAVVLIEQDASAEGQEALPVLARFADHHHQSIVEYMKSATFETKRLMVQEAKAKLEEINAVLKGQGRYMNILSVQSSIDEAELAQLTKDRSFFLLTAMRAYIRCLQGSSAYDLRGFRLVSLWLANNSESEVNQLMMTELKKLPSYKFLGLIPQLAARLSTFLNDAITFQVLFLQLLLSCLTEHPHHSVPVILALAHADLCTLAEEAKRPKKGSRLGRGASVINAGLTQEARTAAQMLLQKLQKSKRHRNFTEWEALSKALVELAYLDVPAQSRKSVAPINMPRDLAITKMSDLQHVGVPTIDVKIDISCEYTDLVKVVNFSRTFKLAGGVNLPKIIQCLGSDGIQRQQLIKGRDDLRQDAVMQQVFQLVNNLLDATPATAKRNLNIRTYKVVPLSQRSGLLEWCQGTMPIGMYLIVKGGGAHRIYRPKDATAEECRKKIYTARMNKGDRLAAYQSVCRDMKPVFRHFFLERFLEPDQWYTKRLAYTRSVATNSMVGYILGLGDRHVQNILIDETSAEMINIDLGIAFEQGKILPTPETVPFRLTRDIVDGMGVTGVEGAFRRCCEECLRVLRKSEEHLLTILEVLLVDPLYDWKMSPMKAMKLQDMRPNDPDTTMGNIFEDETSNSRDSKSENGNIVAERALMRLRQKLQGREHGAQLSHQGQVNLLIQEAMDPRNLSRLFEGWQPYL